MNKIWQADWLMLRNVSPFVCFAHFQVYLQLGGSNTTSVLARKNTNADFISLQPPNQIISKSVGVVFLDLWSAQSTSPNARCVPSEHVLISQNRSTFDFLFAFRTHFTVKGYGMKQYPFLFASNIVTAENNTSLGRHCFGPHKRCSYSHNTRSSLRAIEVRVLRHELPSTHSFSVISAAR